MIRKISLPMMTRVATFEPKTINKEKRTVDVIFTKGARVLRHGFFESFFEELGLKKGEVRMERLESGRAPVLDTHGFGEKRGLNAQIGVVESAKLIPGKEGRATLRFSKRAEVDDIFEDIADGIIRNISVGYNTFKAEKVGEENDIPIFRSVDWEPVEISAVAAGADAGAEIRSKEQDLTECIFVDDTETTTETKNKKRAVENTETEENSENDLANSDTSDKTKNTKNEKLENSENVRHTENTGGEKMTEKELAKIKEDARKQGIADENKRQVEIRSIVAKVKLGTELADTYIKEEKSIDEVRTLVIDALAAADNKSENQTRSTNSSVSGGEDLARKGRIEGMTSALLHRYRPKAIDTRNESGQKMTLPGFELTESGRDYAYLSIIDMARACLEGANIRTGGMPKHTLADTVLGNIRTLNSISDFPEILANVANKTLRSGYLAAPQTWRPFTNEVFVPDFKEISRTNLGDAPKLEKLAEGSEVKRGSISEAAEKYQVEEFAKSIAISRKVIINDDLGALPEFLREWVEGLRI